MTNKTDKNSNEPRSRAEAQSQSEQLPASTNLGRNVADSPELSRFFADRIAYQLKPYANQIANGDCLQILRQLPAACVDFILTDPPYVTNYIDRSGRRIANDDNTRWIFPAFWELHRVFKPDSYAVSFYGLGKAERFLAVWRECGFPPVGHFVWVKRYSSLVGNVQMKHEQAYLLAKGNPPPPVSPPPDVLPWYYTGNRLHPTQKPVLSLTPLIEAFSRPGGLVLDPFAGSGTTGIGARQSRRRFLLIEKDPAYFRAAQDRLNRH
jgi:site-specific DNA-methyltransferase (adenine-specific)